MDEKDDMTLAGKFPKGIHYGRSFTGTRLEDDCPCVKAACGLVKEPVDSCDQHSLIRCKTIRQMHDAEKCPAETGN